MKDEHLRTYSRIFCGIFRQSLAKIRQNFAPGHGGHNMEKAALEKVQGATRLGETGLRASEREICL